MIALKTRINQFFFLENKDYQWISFFRISVGIFLILHLVAILPDFNALFSTHGYIPSDIMDVFIPNFIITLPKIIHFFEMFGIPEVLTLLLFKISYIFFGILLVIGFYPRIMAFLLLLLQIAMIKGSVFYAYGVDFFVSMSLFYLILIPSNDYFSIKTILKRKTKNIFVMPYQRLFQIHLSVLYFFSGLGKVIGFNWRNGESIWKAIHLPFVNQDFQFNFSFLGHHPAILIFIGWSTIIIEIAYPIFIWIPKTRNLWLLLTISMHIGIALVLNLYFFSTIMIIWNLTNFYNFNQKTIS